MLSYSCCCSTTGTMLSQAPDLTTGLCMKFYVLIFKVTWPFKVVLLAQSRTFFENHKFWEDYHNSFKREDSQKTHSFSTAGSTSFRKCSLFLLCSPSITSLNPSHVSLRCKTICFCSAQQCTKTQYNPWQTWRSKTHAAGQPTIQEDTHLCLPSLLLGRQEKHLYGPFVTQAAALLVCGVTLWNSSSLCMRKSWDYSK